MTSSNVTNAQRTRQGPTSAALIFHPSPSDSNVIRRHRHPATGAPNSGTIKDCISPAPASPQISSCSTLVETVSINYEDFSESFLTCSTCLCGFNSRERSPKLLSCSHTVCQSCLERITGLPQSRDTGSFRCPICRETITIPSRGGVSSLPPSFLVNQLMDLMQRQRREVIPKCSAHPTEELLFCETCDMVFCTQCLDSVHAEGSCDHTVVPFSIAIKRMSEILLYKANQCLRNLTRATENINQEMYQLDMNVELVTQQINTSFQEISQLLEERRLAVLSGLESVRHDKHEVLSEQLRIIQQEKAKVEQECNGLQYQVEVRNITKKISDLNQLLDTTSTLMEPRENAFMRYDVCSIPSSGTSQQDGPGPMPLSPNNHNIMKNFEATLGSFGALNVSKTFPPLCTARSGEVATVHLQCHVILTTVDYYGNPRKAGGDPVCAKMVYTPTESTPPPVKSAPSSVRQSVISCMSTDSTHSSFASFNSPPVTPKILNGTSVPVRVTDRENGTYSLSFTPPQRGHYQLEIEIFGRSIKNSPFLIPVSEHNNPIWTYGGLRGSGEENLDQPTRVVCGPESQLYILDTGNNRIKVVTSDGSLLRTFSDGPLEGQSATGLALNRFRSSIFVLNWRNGGRISELSLRPQPGKELASFSFEDFLEPIDLAIDGKGRILVADNGQSRVYAFDAKEAKFLASFKLPPAPKVPLASKPNGTTAAAVRPEQMTCITVGQNDDILVGGSKICIFASNGQFKKFISVTSDPGTKGATPPGVVGGIAVDPQGWLLFTVTTRHRGYVVVCRGYNELTNVQLPSDHSATHHHSSTKTGTSTPVPKSDSYFIIDSFASKLKRPCGLTIGADGHVLVADLGNHILKKYRYK